MSQRSFLIFSDPVPLERTCRGDHYDFAGIRSAEINPMTLEDSYRENAARTLERAKRASSTRDKRRLLRLAEKWLDLADRADFLARRFGLTMRKHPSVKATLGEEHPEIK
jgi:hypothetical protein